MMSIKSDEMLKYYSDEKLNNNGKMIRYVEHEPHAFHAEPKSGEFRTQKHNWETNCSYSVMRLRALPQVHK